MKDILVYNYTNRAISAIGILVAPLRRLIPMDKILFYYEDEPNGFFSNFYRSNIKLKGKDWPTVEHYYQAQKAAGTDYEEKIRLAADPDEAKRLGNLPECPLRSDWDKVKITVMREAVIAKYTQSPVLKERLLNTGDSHLAENSMKDFFWGIGADGSGQNMLGTMLMEVRDELRDGKYE